MLPEYSETFYPETKFFHDADPVDWHLMIVYLVLSNFPPPKKHAQPFEKKNNPTICRPPGGVEVIKYFKTKKFKTTKKW